MNYTIFIVFLYFCSYFGVFLIIRYNLLGTIIEIPFNINYNTLLPIIIPFITYILNIELYLKILDELCYIHIIRLHLYLCKFERYESIKDYLERYIRYRKNVLESDQALLKYLIKEVDVKIVITKYISMKDIREIIQEIISSYKIDIKESSVVTLTDYIKII